MKCRIDIDTISEEAYQVILKELVKCFGVGHFINWELTADKEEIPITNTLVCEKCGSTLFGDSPSIHTICDECQEKEK